jgi:glycosyltransferase involved in cell wall biosynthesis
VTRSLTIIEAAVLPWWNASAYYAVELSSSLSKNGHRVLFAGSPGTPAFEKAREKGVPVIENVDLAIRGPVSFLRTLRNLTQVLRDSRPDILNAHQGGEHLLLALAARGARPAPVIVRTRADIRRPVAHPLERVLYERWTDAVVTSGEFMARQGYFDGFRLGEGRVRPIHPGVDTELFSPPRERGSFRRELGIPEEDVLIGIAARLSPVKGHRTFLGAAAILARKRERVSFLVAGREEQVRREDLIGMAVKSGISGKVYFAGRYADARPIIAALDVGVVASLGSEAVSRVALEYMAMARPVVATTVGVLPETIRHGETGFLVAPGNEQELAAALEKLVADGELRTRMGRAARERVEQEFSLDAMARKTVSLFEELLERRGRGASGGRAG